VYGTAFQGGVGTCLGGGCGVVFKLDPAGNETVLYSFTGGADGANPGAGLIRNAAGNLYGTTTYGGDLNCNQQIGCGVVFKLDSAGNETVLHTFTGADGQQPGGLIADAAGNLYGAAGGGSGCGVVFKLDPSGDETTLHSFTCGADGAFPSSALIRDAAGNLYGTTGSGGLYDAGTIFKLDPSGNESVLYSFTGGADGAIPSASLIRDPAGNLFGTTAGGGRYSWGVVFALGPNGTERVLHAFTGGVDGGGPIASPLLPFKGAIYGTATSAGDDNVTNCNPGDTGCGVVFKLTLQ
jgi:uncharacterized repeat protein (TIGR03803 family)